MTYFGFLALFVGIPLLLLAALTWRDGRRRLGLPGAWQAPAAWVVLLVHVVLAVVYTTPWDNYLVATRVWYYNPARVTGVTFGWVPIEEYTFFVAQTLLTGAWLLWLARHLRPASEPPLRSPTLTRAATGVVALLWLAGACVLAWRWQPGTYLALTLVWMLPPVLLQVAVGAGVLWHHRRWVTLALAPAVLYLSAADALAIRSGVWTISPAQSTGLLLGGVLPVEEFVFFTITNVLIVFGMSLMLARGRHVRTVLAARMGRRKGEQATRSYQESRGIERWN